MDSLPRKQTAVGTAGDIGASYAVIEKNWHCSECKAENYPRRMRCFRCKTPKPDNAGEIILPEGARDTPWREAIDPESQHLYYYNTITMETSWERPEEMGPAPLSTGWFGRGTTRGKTTVQLEEERKKYLNRPARKQQENLAIKNTAYTEGANEYNIWYGRYVGEHWSNSIGKDPAETRCDIDRDSGLTRADKMDKRERYFCIHFARGCCSKGKECTYYHRLPLRDDDANLDSLHDVFGRARHRDHRDDMGGVGSFISDARTLYIGGLKNVQKDPAGLEDKLWEQFGEWGEVENINVIHRLSICFVRYRFRVNAEFAREAMANQSLGDGEILNVRWAYDDPNPVAKEAKERANYDAVISMLGAKGVSTNEQDYDLLAPLTKKQRLLEGFAATVPEEGEEGVPAGRDDTAPPGVDVVGSSAQSEGTAETTISSK